MYRGREIYTVRNGNVPGDQKEPDKLDNEVLLGSVRGHFIPRNSAAPFARAFKSSFHGPPYIFTKYLNFSISLTSSDRNA